MQRKYRSTRKSKVTYVRKHPLEDFKNLPNEILYYQIFARVPHSLIYVCKDWSEFARDTIWKNRLFDPDSTLTFAILNWDNKLLQRLFSEGLISETGMNGLDVWTGVSTVQQNVDVTPILGAERIIQRYCNQEDPISLGLYLASFPDTSIMDAVGTIIQRLPPHHECLRTLLKYEARYSKKTDRLHTPAVLSRIIQWNMYDVVEKNIDKYLEDEITSILHHACAADKFIIVEVLLERVKTKPFLILQSIRTCLKTNSVQTLKVLMRHSEPIDIYSPDVPAEAFYDESIRDILQKRS